MCGIAGIVAFREAPAPTTGQIAVMCDQLSHRGPDDLGIDVQDGVGLGMRRLAVIDLATGKQPIFNEDLTVRVILNGEIYNFRELRRDLEAKGHRFSTSTDTEVVVHLWEEYGSDFPAYLNGMFAIALHDSRRKRLILVRDHIGIKPLFYTVTDDYLIFGSEVKALLATGLVNRRLDEDGLGQFLAWEYVPAPGTLFKGIRKLEPAHLLDVELSRQGRGRPDVQPRRYWDIPLPPDHAANGAGPRSPVDWEEAVDLAIRNCVRRQKVSDVPLGAFLSGGVDSSLVVAAMGNARTFSIGFDDPTYNEIPWAERVARNLGVRHTYEVLRPQAADLFDRLMHYMDDPIGDFSIFSTYLLSQYARRHVKVALSGDGGDELFGGYETYAAQQMARRWRRLPSFLRRGMVEPAIAALRPTNKKKGMVNKAKRFVEGLSYPDTLGHARWRLFAGDSLRQHLLTPETLRATKTAAQHHIVDLMKAAGPRDECDRGLYVDVRSYLADNCLVKLDRMSMACSLEARVPLLDKELVELAFSMPSTLKVRGLRTKVLLKRVAARHVSRECVYRPKEGFSIPLKHWLKTELRLLLEELLSPRRVAADGILQSRTIDRLKSEHLSGKANHSHVLWSLMVFQDWKSRWKV